jgi:hypothetical protein
MKERDKKDRRGPPTGGRTGPRARALQERGFDPYQHAERPARTGPPRDRLHAPAAGAIRLDPDVARVFRDSESVNEALRLVLRLARLAGGRPPSAPRARPDSFRDRGGPPRRPDRPERGDRPPPRRPKFEE